MGQKASRIPATVLKAVGLAASLAVVVTNTWTVVPIETTVTLLGIGLFAIALASFIGGKGID